MQLDRRSYNQECASFSSCYAIAGVALLQLQSSFDLDLRPNLTDMLRDPMNKNTLYLFCSKCKVLPNDKCLSHIIDPATVCQLIKSRL